MGEIRHPNHGTNMGRKAIRYADQLKASSAADVAEALQRLALSCPLGERLAELCWTEIAKVMPPRESVNGPVPEDAPGADTVAFIVALCEFDAILDPTIAADIAAEEGVDAG